jgi:hypothetical protein
MAGRVKVGSRKAAPEMLTRLIAVIPKDEKQKGDAWDVAADTPSRTAAIGFLLEKGLETAGTTATGHASQALSRRRLPIPYATGASSHHLGN